MSTDHKTDNKQIVDTLAAAGWTPEKEIRDGYFDLDVCMHFRNDTFDIGVTRWDTMAAHTFFFEVTEGRLGPGLTDEENEKYSSTPTGQMYIEYRDKLDDVLKAIIAFAKEANMSNIGEKLKAVLAVTPRAYNNERTAGAQGDVGEAYTVTINPDTWYPMTKR